MLDELSKLINSFHFASQFVTNSTLHFQVNEAARPDMGPNLYITPPGTFTRFHQDGFGTVDSGHLCMSGYNEVVMFRRLPPGHDRNAINTEGSSLYEMPHADKLVRMS
jgi:hypothetical protein